jgi:phospholipase D1/2
LSIPTYRATRLAFLVDAAGYFAAVAESIERATRSVFILGWDVDARTRLPDPRAPGRTINLRDLLNRKVRATRDLRIRILGWDYSTLFVLERQMFPKLHLGWRTHRRVLFEADATHPVGAAHHQKIIVIDDRVAYSGGLDLTVRRWDTRRHLPDDPERVDPGGEPYRPFHDIQIAVEGEAAEALAEIARERWWRATGEAVREVPPSVANDPWPKRLTPHAKNATVSISRTQGESEIQPPLREVEATLLGEIAAAKRSLYIENQYLSSEAIGDALARRLDEDDGPELIVVLPRSCAGWLEKRSMGVLRGRVLAKLTHAKHPERLRCVYPSSGSEEVYVHSKVLVADDATARVGSANLSRRSLMLDTECDVTVIAGDDPDVSAAVARFRDGLLAEHLGTSAGEIARRRKEGWSLVRIVDELGEPWRRLAPLEDECSKDEATGEAPWVADFADPEAPLDGEHLFGALGDKPTRSKKLGVATGVAASLALVALGVAWMLGTR